MSENENSCSMNYQKTNISEFKCHKKVKAFKIDEVRLNPPDSFSCTYSLRNYHGKHQAIVSEKYFTKHKPQTGGYYVLYEDGYESYSPAKAFEEGYSLSGDVVRCKTTSLTQELWSKKLKEELEGQHHPAEISAETMKDYGTCSREDLLRIIQLDDKRIEALERVVKLIPECKTHGDLCLPNAGDWIKDILTEYGGRYRTIVTDSHNKPAVEKGKEDVRKRPMAELVKIEWVDSVKADDSWERLCDYGHLEAYKCVSVGFLVYDGETTKGIAQSIADPDDPENTQVSGIVHIPVCSITRIVELEEAVKGGG